GRGRAALRQRRVGARPAPGCARAGLRGERGARGAGRRPDRGSAAPARATAKRELGSRVTDLFRLDATELAQGIRTRRFSSREAVASCLARLDAVNPRINAVVDVLAEQALVAADAADRAVASGQATGALHGVPITLK